MQLSVRIKPTSCGRTGVRCSSSSSTALFSSLLLQHANANCSELPETIIPYHCFRYREQDGFSKTSKLHGWSMTKSLLAAGEITATRMLHFANVYSVRRTAYEESDAIRVFFNIRFLFRRTAPSCSTCADVCSITTIAFIYHCTGVNIHAH